MRRIDAFDLQLKFGSVAPLQSNNKLHQSISWLKGPRFDPIIPSSRQVIYIRWNSLLFSLNAMVLVVNSAFLFKGDNL